MLRNPSLIFCITTLCVICCSRISFGHICDRYGATKGINSDIYINYISCQVHVVNLKDSTHFLK